VMEVRDLFIDDFVDGNRRYAGPVVAAYQDCINNYVSSPSYAGVESIKSVVTAALASASRNPSLLRQLASTVPTSDSTIQLTNLWRRTPLVIRHLKTRYSKRAPLIISDEHDLQDLFEAILSLFFDDVRREEWTPSYAGGSARMDFFLPHLNAVVELKMMRASLSTKDVGEQLLIDIARYRQTEHCQTLYCFVYDPEHLIANPRGLEGDLSKSHGTMKVVALIVPQ